MVDLYTTAFSNLLKLPPNCFADGSTYNIQCPSHAQTYLESEVTIHPRFHHEKPISSQITPFPIHPVPQIKLLL
ncbi:hypothetical protein WAI453_009904 [Rhynchosporium graminicola]